jgi:Na+-transporting methylmalonyl-CoA/oxaloacetate decarboxylase gamma subunit
MIKPGFFFVLLLLAFTSCAGESGSLASRQTAPAAGSTETSAAPAARREDNALEAQQVSLSQAENSQTQPAVTERKIIRNAELQLETDAPEEAQRKIAAIVEGKDGFVIESAQSSSDVRATARDTVTMTLRVPAAKFNESIDEIRKTASRVIVETVKGEDVTEEFIDVEARLKASKSLEAQFLEIMKQAKTVEDALNVQRELAKVRGEIEKIEGRKRFLENQAAFSTIKIQLKTPAAFTSGSAGFSDRLRESVGDGFDAALNFVLGLVTLVLALLPFLVLVVLPLGLVIRYFWRKRSRMKPVTEIAREEIKKD